MYLEKWQRKEMLEYQKNMMQNKNINGSARVYVIKSNLTDKIYIRSTRQKLNARLTAHKSNYKQYIEGKIKSYTSSYEIVKFGECYIELLNEYINISNNQLRKFETNAINDNKIKCVNKNSPISS